MKNHNTILTIYVVKKQKEWIDYEYTKTFRGVERPHHQNRLPAHRKAGSDAGRKAALAIYPPILKELAKEVKQEIFVVCGTNGKTTTNNLLSSVLEANGKKSGLQPHRFQYVKRG